MVHVREWEIWHSYSTHLRVHDIDLPAVARRLVEGGVAHCVIHRDGETFWRDPQGRVGRGVLSIEMVEGGGSAKVQPPSDLEGDASLEGFAGHCVRLGSSFRFHELRVFPGALGLPAPYIRIYLGEHHLVTAATPERDVRLYPVVVLFQSGVILVELRTTNPKHSIPLDYFVRNCVNLFQHQFDGIKASPGVARAVIRAHRESPESRQVTTRTRLLADEFVHSIAVEQQVEAVHVEGGFPFELVRLPRHPDANFESLSTLALTIVEAIRVNLFPPGKWRFLFRGPDAYPPRGDLWVGRPHTYLIDFDDRPSSASAIPKDNRELVQSILYRQVIDENEILDLDLPPDGRPFDDFAAFIGEGGSLWIWSKKGVDRQEQWEGPQRSHLVYTHQAEVEMLEYGYSLYVAYAESAGALTDRSEVSKFQADVVDLEDRLERVSSFGEVRERLRQGWERWGVPTLRERLDRRLSIVAEQASITEQRRTVRVGQSLTVLFGLTAAPRVADAVIEPAWNLLGLPLPSDANAASLLLFAVALVAVVLLVGVVYAWASGRDERAT